MALAAYDYVEQKPKGEGTDYRVGGRVLLRFNGMRVVWRPGSTDWCGVGDRSYYQAILQVENLPGNGSAVTLFEGGRLSQAKWLRVRESIAYQFKVPMDWIPEDLPTKTLTLRGR